MAEQKDAKAPPVDAKAYYGYLFEADKKPTKVLDALLRAIALYISEHIGDTEQRKLTPDKLAAFYKAVGGNYDSLFVALPPPSISWIYASIGCQHTLQPAPNDDFIPPCIPALTIRGFVRWQSIEILLGPEEHVPFIQSALSNFHLVHPDTGEPFPVDIPPTAFPLVPDPDIEKWHEQCAKALRKRATPNEELGNERPREERPDMPQRPRVSRGTFSHVHVHPGSEYFDREPKYRTRPPMTYQHVSSASAARPSPRPGLSHSPAHRARQFLAPEDTQPQRSRRRSFPEESAPSPAPREPNHYNKPEVAEDQIPVNPHPPMNASRPGMNGRRHSHDHPRRRGSESSDASSEESDTSPGHRSRRPKGGHRTAPASRDHSATRDPPNTVRYSMPPPEARPRPRPRNKEEDAWKRRSYTGSGILSDIGGKFGFGHKRDNSRGTPTSTGSRDGIRWKDLDGLGGGSGDDRGSASGRERRREGAPMDRRSVSYRDRDRERERERDKERYSGGDRERPYTGDPARERANTGDRSRYTSPIRGVDGRRYPSGH